MENLVECGCNVPMALIKGLAVTEKLLADEAACSSLLVDDGKKEIKEKENDYDEGKKRISKGMCKAF